MLAAAGRFGAVVCCALASAGCGGGNGSVPSPGTDLYAASAEGILEVALTSAAQRVYAFRWAPGEPFQIVAARPGQKIETCLAGEGFRRFLEAVSSLRVVAQASEPADRGDSWAQLRIVDASGIEPIEVTIRVPRRDEQPVLVEVDQRQFVVAVDAAALRLTASGCGGLGAGG